MPVDRALHVTIEAELYALGVSLRSDDPALRFTDNHFDLASGERHRVVVTNKTGAAVDPESIAIACWNGKRKR
jgi:hypothetical protein